MRIPPPPRTPSFGPRRPEATSGTRLVQPSPSRDGAFSKDEPTSFDKRRTPVVPAEWPNEERAARFPDDEPVTTKREGVPGEPEPVAESASLRNETARPETTKVADARPDDVAADGGVLHASKGIAASAAAEQLPISATTGSETRSELSAPVAEQEQGLEPSLREPRGASLAPAGEHDFFAKEPIYSIEPPVLFSVAPRAKPSVVRGVLSKLMFLAIGASIGLLAYYEMAVALKR
jgi:hypothetical protein